MAGSGTPASATTAAAAAAAPHAEVSAQAHVFLERGVALAEAGDAAAAVPLLRRAAGLDPASAAAREMLAQACMEAGLDEEAYEAATAAAALHAHWPAARLTLARAARNSGRLCEAANALAAYLTAAPGDGEAAAEAEELASLLEQVVGHQVGLPGLRLCQQQSAEAGPGGAVWEAGALLAWFLVHHSRPRQEGQQAQEQPSCCRNVGCMSAPACAARGCAQRLQPTADPVPSVLRGARVLELGSGCSGVGALAAACLGANVLATDLPAVLPQLQSNLRLNGELVAAGGGSVAAAALDWGAADPVAALATAAGARAADGVQAALEVAAAPSFDWVIGSDLIYSTASVPALVATIAAAQERVGTAPDALPMRVVIAHKHRHAAVDRALLSALEAKGLRLKALLRDQGSRVTIYGNQAAAEALEGCE